MSTSSSSRTRCSKYSIKEIKAATNQFDSRKILGQGGEAKVYFAEIYIGSNKTPVAVKHLKENSKEFEREIHTLSKIHHPNLVSLIGYCNESDHKILVYEYMAKGCLSDYLKKKSSVSLSWLQRLKICLGAARGLQHLHTETYEFPKGIIHRDVKPGNILVGKNWVGKLSDFGMFKLSNAGQDKSLMTTNLKGTSGYYAPEYIKYRRITRKIDVYAFGVVLFEALCRKMPWDREDESYYADEDEDLGFWAQQNVDALIQGEITGDSLAVFTDIIGRSLQANPGRRPTMDDVVLDLQKALECQESVYLAKQLEGSPRGFEGITSKVYTLEDIHNLTTFMDDHPDSARDMMEDYYLGDAIVNTGGFEGITSKVYTLDPFYHFIISFRGSDTRNYSFTSSLLKDLERRILKDLILETVLLISGLEMIKLKSFMDDQKILTGEKKSIIEGIQKSMRRIIIFSENYASSTWCLEELTLILEAHKKRNGDKIEGWRGSRSL